MTRSPFSEVGFLYRWYKISGWAVRQLGVGIEACSLGFAYDAHSVFSDVCFSVEPGSFMGVVGPNGAGKTTLLRCLAGLARPRKGHVKLGASDIAGLSRLQIARLVALVPQDTNVTFDFTCEEFALLGRLPHQGRAAKKGRCDRDVVREAMAMTGTSAFAERLITSLSGGERQRVAIARALAQEPKVMLLDEPTSHLDIGYQVDVLDMVRVMCRDQGITVAAVFHDLNLASIYCDQVLVVADGSARLRGAPREVLTQRNMAEIYGDRVVVDEHPVHDTPLVAPRSCCAERRWQGQGRLTMLTGGARSGKSSYAERLATQAGGRVLYVATCELSQADQEMQERVRMHKSRRPATWTTVETTLDAATVIEAEGNSYDAVILDCLGLFVTNHLFAQDEHASDGEKTQVVLREVERLAQALSGVGTRSVVVTNEVGSGVVPPYPLGRLFRDVLGWANQIVASCADDVYTCISGIPVRIK